MTVLVAPDTSAYDVLGVSPDASPQEIHAAFHWLIKRGGYRIGVPLRGRWLRAHQIKEAYATLGDPIKRRVYDESLEGASGRTLWSATPDDDPGLAALLFGEEQPPPEWTDKSNKAAFSFGKGEGEHAPVGTIESGNDEIVPAVDQPATSPGDEQEDAAGGAIEPGNDEVVPAVDERPTSPRDEPLQAPSEAMESGNDEITQDIDERPTLPKDEAAEAPVVAIGSSSDEIVPGIDEHETSPEEITDRDEVKYGSAKLWGGAAAAALALGSLVYFSWPSGEPQLPGTETAAQLPPSVQQVNPDVAMTGRLATLPPSVEPDGTVGKVGAQALGDTAPVPDASGATETTVPGAAPTTVAIANETQAPSGAAAAAGDQVASPPAPAPAPVASGLTSPAAEAAAAAGPAPAPPRAQAPSAVPSVTVRPGASVAGSPAQLIGGGPTKVDNPRGRYVGSVIVQFTVQADGRVSNCGPVRGSGNADLDALTCRLVEQRMRFKPALDAQGNPVASTAHAQYEWGRRRRYPSLMSWMFRRPR